MSDDSWNWLNPPGPFRGLRRFLWWVIFLSLLLIAILLALASYGYWYPSSNAGMVGFLWLYFGIPWMLVLIGAAWVIDNIVGFLKA